LSTEKLVYELIGLDDTSNCTLLVGSFASRSFTLVCIDDKIFGTDGSGDFFDCDIEQFIKDYEGCAWLR
jgi:hypothetical protein